MGNTWQTKDQQEFFEEHLALYSSSRDGGKLKEEFWPMITEEFFKRWPLTEPPAELVGETGSIEKAMKAWRDRRIGVSISQRRAVFSWTYSSIAGQEGLQGQGYRECGSKPTEPSPRRQGSTEEV